jgi:hypothetical protein
MGLKKKVAAGTPRRDEANVSHFLRFQQCVFDFSRLALDFLGKWVAHKLKAGQGKRNDQICDRGNE